MNSLQLLANKHTCIASPLARLTYMKCGRTYIKHITPDGSLEAQVCLCSRRKLDVELSDQRLDAHARKSCECLCEGGLAREERLLDVALETDSEAVERDTSVGLDIFEDGDLASRLRVVAT